MRRLFTVQLRRNDRNCGYPKTVVLDLDPEAGVVTYADERVLNRTLFGLAADHERLLHEKALNKQHELMSRYELAVSKYGRNESVLTWRA